MKVLPQTFRDAIEVAKAMSIPYLWVDALCIIQDSEQDKNEEISVMERIYRESLVTIVAAVSGNAMHGFLQPRPRPYQSYPIPFRLAEGRFGSMCIQELDLVEYAERSEAINKRAWTLQEQLIPHRFLIYASHTLQWRCNAGVQNLGRSLHYAAGSDDQRYCDTFRMLSRPATGRRDQLLRWLRIIHIYSLCTASLSSDKLTALAAIAKEFSNELGPGYYAGLWEFSLLWQLTWTTWFPYVTDDNSPPITRPAVYRAPSWSWASINGRVWYDIDILDEDEPTDLYRCDIIHCENTLKSTDSPFGESSAASLKIRVVLRKAWFLPSTRNILWLAEEDPTLAAAEIQHLAGSRRDNPDVAHDLEYDWGDFEGQYDVSGDWPPAVVYCLPVVASREMVTGLLLAPDGSRTFKRVGSFTHARRDDFDDLQQVEVIIV